jgi:hypothetical protein
MPNNLLRLAGMFVFKLILIVISHKWASAGVDPATSRSMTQSFKKWSDHYATRVHLLNRPTNLYLSSIQLYRELGGVRPLDFPYINLAPDHCKGHKLLGNELRTISFWP